MRIDFFCPRWGSEDLSWDTFCKKAKAEGYDGVESSIPFESQLKDEMKEVLEENKLLLIGQYYQSFEKEIKEHKKNYERHLENILSMRPIKIDSQTGKDYFSLKQNQELFNIANGLTLKTGIPIAHETHRNKALFAAHISHQLLKETPDLFITADFSHWCNVAESLLEDQQDATSLACRRAIHIHARVGYSEGPQVNDPRAPEWSKEFNAHLQWWDVIIEMQKNKDLPYFTITPEFGPSPYMNTNPYTKSPIASQWDINVFMMNFLRKRYSPTHP